MKKLLSIMMIIAAAVLVIPTVSAASAPELVSLGGKNILLANGTAITVEEPTDSTMAALVKWDGGEIHIPAGTSIFGGYHYNTTDTVDTSITVNGGTVKNVFGGGLHQSLVGTSTIVINGGTITGAIMGGGYDGFVGYGSCSHPAANLTADLAKTSTVKVETATITINGGNLDGIMIYGGGGGYSYTGAATITINDHEGTIAYLIGGGSNGYTGTASIKMNDGSVDVVQSVNRGSMDSAEITIAGGEVTNAYVGGEPDPSVTGTIAEAKMSITGGAVENVAVGTNGVDQSGASISASDVASLDYVKGTVETVDETTFEEIVEYVILTVDVNGETSSEKIAVGSIIPKDDVSALEDTLAEELKDTEYELGGFYADKEYKTEFDFSKAINEDTTVYIKLNKKVIAEEVVNPTPSEKPEVEDVTNSETADINIVAIVSILALATVGLGYTIKKRRFN